MKVAVVGAGVSGLAAARTFRALGLDVVVFDSAPDLGGVWSATRRYPGISIQNDKDTYSFSDLPMPAAYPEFPEGHLVRAYLEQWAEKHDLLPVVRLRTRVERAEPGEHGGWSLQVNGPGTSGSEHADWLVVANGVFSTPHQPHWPGRAEFEQAGGRVLSPSEVGDGDLLDDRHVVVVGWGKSGCDIAAAATRRSAKPVVVVARTVRWKLPKRMGRITFQHVLLSRLGEHLMWAPYRTPSGRALRLLDRPVRRAAVRGLGRAMERSLRLADLGLEPQGGPSDIDSLVTEGFFDAVRAGAIRVRDGRQVRELTTSEGRPLVVLDDGSVLPCDTLVAATGYEQDISMFPRAVRDQLLEPDGSMLLHRSMVPPRVPQLAFTGWTHSFRSPIGAEIQALWIAAAMLGMNRSRRAGKASPRFYLTHAAAASARAAQLPPNTSILDLDEWIADFGGRVPMTVRLAEVLRALRPSSYQRLIEQFRRRAGDRTSATPPAA